MRVLLVTHYYADHKGGIEIVAEAVARTLRLNRVSVMWAASSPAPGSLHSNIIGIPMNSWNVVERITGIPYPLWSPYSFFKLFCVIKKADIVHVHESFYLGSIFAAIAGWLMGTPVVVTQHVGEIPYRSSILRLALGAVNHTIARAVLRLAAQVVFVSHVVENYYASFTTFQRPPIVIANGVDPDLFYPVDDSHRKFLRRKIGWPQETPCIEWHCRRRGSA